MQRSTPPGSSPACCRSRSCSSYSPGGCGAATSAEWAVVALVTGVALLSVPPTSGLPFGTSWLYLVVSVAYLVTSVQLRRVRGAKAAESLPRGVEEGQAAMS